QGNIVPTVNNTYDIGTPTLAYNQIYSYAYPAPSDKRLKDNIRALRYGLDEIMRLNPVSYFYKADIEKKNRLGLIAQETERIVPEVVSTGTDANQTKAINYSELIPVLIKAIQEQQQLIEKQNATIANLQDENKEVSGLKTLITQKMKELELMQQKIDQQLNRFPPTETASAK
ncbi:MAG TPA: tail fiber domain-containing protein, partial [Flavobacterium sp.]|nr:tail fiber domain-containing protein [Flavobacterium sp.]